MYGGCTKSKCILIQPQMRLTRVQKSCGHTTVLLRLNARDVITFLEMHYSRTDFVYLKLQKRIIAVFASVELYKHVQYLSSEIRAFMR